MKKSMFLRVAIGNGKCNTAYFHLIALPRSFTSTDQEEPVRTTNVHNARILLLSFSTSFIL